MELKDYQIKVLEYLENYLAKLGGQYQDKLEYYEFQQSNEKLKSNKSTIFTTNISIILSLVH